MAQKVEVVKYVSEQQVWSLYHSFSIKFPVYSVNANLIF